MTNTFTLQAWIGFSPQIKSRHVAAVVIEARHYPPAQQHVAKLKLGD